MGKLINNKRAVKWVLMGLIAVIIGFAAILFSVSMVNGDKEVSAQSSVDTVSSQNMVIDSSSEYADKLYGCLVSDFNDTAAVVKLLETMGLESVAGKYNATIKTEGDMHILSVSLEDSVQKTGKKVLDGNMKKCAQQIMALVPSVGQVQWTYSLISSGEADETVTVSVDEEAAAEKLSKDIKSYGNSADTFKALLEEQAGLSQ